MDNDRYVLQLGGNSVEKMERCVSELSVQRERNHYCFSEINLNCGCPSIESGGAAEYGASLMKQPELTRDLLEAIHRSISSSHQVDVSLKCRIGLFDTPDDMMLAKEFGETSYQQLHQYIATANQGGAIQHLILHARPVVLSGLSPVKNRIVPTLHYDVVMRIARDFPGLKVTLNGGLTGIDMLETISSQRTNDIASFMAGRWILRRPLDLTRIRSSPSSLCCKSEEQEEEANDRIIKALKEYGQFVLERSISSPKWKHYAFTIAELCLPLYLVIQQLDEDYNQYWDEKTDIKRRINPTLLSRTLIEELHDEIREILAALESSVPNRKKKSKLKSGRSVSCVNFKMLTLTLKGLVGSKVLNKWKRNRAELLL